MPKQQNRLANKLSWLIPLIASLLLAGSACHLIHKPVEVEKLLTPLAEADTPRLANLVNGFVKARSIRGKVDIQFEDTSFATSGIAEKYRTADGSIILQRPGKVYLIVQGPLAIDIAQMTSDGEHFRIAILKGEDKYRRFVRGTNAAVYSELDGSNADSPKGKPNTDAQTVKALSNLRPQHLTEALLIRPIDEHANGIMYARSEFFQSEKDSTSQKRVVRGYYLLDELQAGTDGTARLLRRFWFDRVNGIRFARLQTFNQDGALITDVTYNEFKRFGTEGEVVLPSKISVTRPQDHYQLTITYQSPESVVLDHDYPPDVFVLENKWGLGEVDLDSPKKP